MTPPTPDATAGKILVIDDNPIIQRAMHHALKDKSYTVLMSGEISDALKNVREHRPDVILLDLNFPPDGSLIAYSLRDGFSVLAWLRHLDEAKGTPIIVISGDAPEKSKAPSLAAGAAAYFHKPVDNQELATTIADLIARKSTKPPA